MNTFKFGQRIRAEDFRFHRHYFVEGRIIEVNAAHTHNRPPYAHYAVRCERDSLVESDDTLLSPGATRVGEIVYVPIDLYNDWPERLTLLEVKS